MNTNFFSTIQAIGFTGSIKLHIQQEANGIFIVSVLLENRNVEDNARHLIPPLLLNGSSEELDSGFFECITKPVKKTSELFLNMKQYEMAQEEARKASKAEQDKKDKEKKEKEESKKKFDTQMKKVDELEKQNKFREACAQLPKTEDYPDEAERLDEKRKFLTEKFEQPSLF